MNGAIAGGQIGYNWQSNNWVFGLEADAQWSDEKGGGVFNCAATLIGGPCLPGLTFLPAGATGTILAIDQHLEWFGTVRGRVGMLVTPRVLLYGTGGLAYGSFKTTGALAGFNGNGVAVASIGSNSDIRFGWTVGAGVEGKITNNWSAKLEYLYMDFDTFRAGTFSLAPLATVGANVDTRFHDHVLRVGLNYTFGGPVIAKY
jgi:outer membrane immunogenic protein